MTASALTTHQGIEGACELTSPVFKDKRGSFQELFHLTKFYDLGLKLDWMQDNFAVSQPNVLRGLHIQRRRPQGKLVRCLHGSIVDVGVDLRIHSPTFKNSLKVILDNPNKAVYWPPGIAHGYYSEKESFVHYKCTTIYDKESDGGILWCDPDLGINWGDISPVVSQKDMCLPKLLDYLKTLR